MQTTNTIDISKLSANAQSALLEIYKLLLKAQTAEKEIISDFISDSVKVKKITIPSRDERNAR